jgi:hypothetical protein
MQLALHITLVKPPAKLTYSLQKGSGAKYEVIQVQCTTGQDLFFELTVEVKDSPNTNEEPDFKGPFVQGPVGGRFIYLDIGSYAGAESYWSGRLKIPLTGISWATIAAAGSEHALHTTVPGTRKNGMPACATVKPFEGWKVKGGKSNYF